MRATVFGLPASHPVKAGELMLRHKGVGVRRIDLPPVISRAVLRAIGFPGPTVPAVRIAGRRVQTTRALARALDELVPDRALFPADPGRRAAVDEAERWGDEVLQPVPRRLSYVALGRDRSQLSSFFERPLLGVPGWLAAMTAGPIIPLAARINSADDETTRADLAELPGLIDRVDALIADGVIGGDEPNAADFQIAPSVRLLMAFEDIRPFLEGRPAAEHALAVVPRYAGNVPPVFPSEWLAPLRGAGR